MNPDALLWMDISEALLNCNVSENILGWLWIASTIIHKIKYMHHINKWYLHKWQGTPFPNGYLTYLATFTGGSIEIFSNSSGSKREAPGSVGWNKL